HPRSCRLFLRHQPQLVRWLSDLYREREAADTQCVAAVQDGRGDATAVDECAVETVQIGDAPGAVREGEAAVTTTDVRKRQANIRLAVTSEQHDRTVELHRLTGRLQHQPQWTEVVG